MLNLTSLKWPFVPLIALGLLGGWQGAALAQSAPAAAVAPGAVESPGSPPAQPAQAPATLTDEARESTQAAVEKTRELLFGYTITLGASIKQSGLREDKGITSQDAPTFLPKGGTGTDILTGDKIGQAEGLWLDATSPVTYFEGSDKWGYGFDFGYSDVTFDKYASGLGYDVTHTSGSLTGQFVRFMPTLVTTRGPFGSPEVYSDRGSIGLGAVASRYSGTMDVRHSTVYPHDYANETYTGSGKWALYPAVYVDLRMLLWKRMAVSLSELILVSHGVYYIELGLNLGVSFRP